MYIIYIICNFIDVSYMAMIHIPATGISPYITRIVYDTYQFMLTTVHATTTPGAQPKLEVRCTLLHHKYFRWTSSHNPGTPRTPGTVALLDTVRIRNTTSMQPQPLPEVPEDNTLM